MINRLRSNWTAASGALLLILTLSGVAAGASLVSDALPTEGADVAPLVDTTLTWEDTDGNGVDDDCQEAVVADADAALAADAAVDLDHDGTVSVSEAAQSGRIGGTNCNHGGYVRAVAQGDEAADETADEETTDDAPATDCEVAPVVEPTPVVDPTPVVEPTPALAPDTAPNAHGKAVSEVAKSDAVGGKNCNHGGAVSAVAKDPAARAAAKATRDAAKAERQADHAAAKAARDAAKAERKAARDAAKAARHHGKPGG